MLIESSYYRQVIDSRTRRRVQSGKTLQKLAWGARLRPQSVAQRTLSEGLIGCGTASQLLMREPGGFACPPGNLEGQMSYKEPSWMACDVTEQLRAEYGPFHTRPEAEMEARKLGFGYLLRYEHILGVNEEIEEVRCIFIELPGTVSEAAESTSVTLHTQ